MTATPLTRPGAPRRPSASGMPVVGMVGGGQLSRMTAQAAVGLGVALRVLTRGLDDSAAQVVHGPVLGDETALPDLRAFARGVDVLTFDHEHVPSEHIATLEADGVAVRPGSSALRSAQDKRVMRERLSELGVAIPRSGPAASAREVEAFAAESGWPLVLKTARGGYDGRGVWVVEDVAAAQRVLAATGDRPMLVEEHVAFRRELAALVARSPSGQGAAWQVVETVQVDAICHEVLAPAPDLHPELAEAAEEVALRIARDLDVVGVLAVELFDTDAGLLVNELAMRPHNSGHWTIEGSRTSQFEQHLRAVMDLPLGATTATAPAVAMANVLGSEASDAADLAGRLVHVMALDPAVKVHLYGKGVRPGRKIGHVTALGADMESARARAREAAHYLAGR